MIRVSKIFPTQSPKDREHNTLTTKNTDSKEVDPEQSVFFNTLKPMLTPEALAMVLHKKGE